MDQEVPDLLTPASGRYSHSRRYYLKMASITIGVLIGISALGGLILALVLLSMKMAPMKELATTLVDWQTSYQGNSSTNTSVRAPALQAKKAVNTTASVLGLLIISMGIPNIIQLIVSIRLITGAFQEHYKLVKLWIEYTKKAMTINIFLTVFVVISLFAVKQTVLAFAICGLLFLMTMTMIFFLLIVDQYKRMIRRRQENSFFCRKEAGTIV